MSSADALDEFGFPHPPAVLVELPAPVEEIAALAENRVVIGYAPAGLPERLDHLTVTMAPTAEERLPRTCVSGSLADAESLVARAVERPRAARALVDVLRVGATLPIGEALTLESLAYSMLLAGPEFIDWRSSHRVRPPVAESDVVALERSGASLVITLDRVHRRNAFSALMRDQLCEALALARDDGEITEVLLRGAGGNFSSGGDLDEFGTNPDVAAAHAVRTARSAGRLLADLGDRARVTVHGACIGAGVELPAFARQVQAAPGTTFRLPELDLGLIPGAGGTVSVTRRIGRWRTAWLALSGREISAERALLWGLVDDIA